MEIKTEVPKVDLLERLGFKTAATRVKDLKDRKRKLALAYELYRFVRPEKIEEFNRRLRAKTSKPGRWGMNEYQTLAFTPIGTYQEVPPAHVLASLETAQGHKCFDSFEIAHIVDVKDPILFGRINNCDDRFYIDQWDNDVRIEDILASNEG